MHASPKPYRYRNGYTFIELLAVMFLVFLITVAFNVVRPKFGLGAGLAAGAVAFCTGVMLIVLMYRWRWRCDKQKLTHLREKYRTIYRVKELPSDARSIVKPEDAEIQVGDYAWDARPNRRDGLVHLQGLTVRWQVVWHAAFRPDQIERVAEKPASQYDYWAPDWAKPPTPPPCPFPVRDRDTPTMGLPHHSGYYFTNYPSKHYYAPGKKGG